MFNGNIHYKWSFSIATLNYQRVIKNKYFSEESKSSSSNIVIGIVVIIMIIFLTVYIFPHGMGSMMITTNHSKK